MNGEIIELFEAGNTGRGGTRRGPAPALAVAGSGPTDGPPPGGDNPDTLTPEQVRAVKQAVMADVTCVLARAGGIDIEPRRAFAAARNLCEILFSHPDRPGTDIPKLFWETPLGQAVGACCGDRNSMGDAPDPLVKTTLHLPQSVRDRLRLEAEVSGKSVSTVLTEKLVGPQ